MTVRKGSDEIIFQPIAEFHCPYSSKRQLPRQGSSGDLDEGEVVFLPRFSDTDLLRHLEGFSHIWLIYSFHDSQGWKPLVQPPRKAKGKVGVFASRSPYRPNSIGLSCVALNRIENGKLFVSNYDLLDGTPILDIKPYIIEADCFPQARRGWLESLHSYSIHPTPLFRKQLEWLDSNIAEEIRSAIKRDLEYNPLQSRNKRLWPMPRDRQANVLNKINSQYFSAFGTWRLHWRLDQRRKQIFLLCLFSGYSMREMASNEDPYSDKRVHHSFRKRFRRTLSLTNYFHNKVRSKEE